MLSDALPLIHCRFGAVSSMLVSRFRYLRLFSPLLTKSPQKDCRRSPSMVWRKILVHFCHCYKKQRITKALWGSFERYAVSIFVIYPVNFCQFITIREKPCLTITTAIPNTTATVTISIITRPTEKNWIVSAINAEGYAKSSWTHVLLFLRRTFLVKF